MIQAELQVDVRLGLQWLCFQISAWEVNDRTDDATLDRGF